MAPLQHVPNCFGCSIDNPASLGIALTATPGGAEGRVRFGADAEGAPGLVHGGLLATFADEVMGFVSHGGNAVRLTAEMTIRYRRPTPLDTELVCRAAPGAESGRRFTVNAVITRADDDGAVLAEAEATYVLLVPSARAPRPVTREQENPMDVQDLILISVDDHVVEPPTMFDEHWPKKYADRIPRCRRGRRRRRHLGVRRASARPNVGLNAVAGCPPDEYNLDPTEYTQMRPGCFDVHERVRDMSAAGVLAGLNFPTFPHFCGQFFGRIDDKDVALAAVRAYNDWHIDEWAGAYPDRFIPLSIPPLWDPPAMADEIRRVAAKGCHAVTFSENPSKLGLPSYHTEHWDPFFAACVDAGSPSVCTSVRRRR